MLGVHAQELLLFLDACMLKQRLPDAAFEKFEELSSKQLEGLHKLVKDLQVSPLKSSRTISCEQIFLFCLLPATVSKHVSHWTLSCKAFAKLKRMCMHSDFSSCGNATSLKDFWMVSLFCMLPSSNLVPLEPCIVAVASAGSPPIP